MTPTIVAGEFLVLLIAAQALCLLGAVVLWMRAREEPNREVSEVTLNRAHALAGLSLLLACPSVLLAVFLVVSL